MKNFFLCGLIAITLPCCVQAQPDSIQILKEIQSDPVLVRMGNELLDARDSLWESYVHVYEDILLCSPSNNDAVFDTLCFLGLSQRLTKTGDLLRVYVKLLKQNETPVSIKGLEIYVMIEMNSPDIDSLEHIVTKFSVAAHEVLVCVRGRATEGPCSSVDLSVSDAVNSLGLALDWFKK